MRLPITVRLVEPLGSDTLIHFDLAGVSAIARVDPELRPKVGDRLRFASACPARRICSTADDGQVLHMNQRGGGCAGPSRWPILLRTPAACASSVSACPRSIRSGGSSVSFTGGSEKIRSCRPLPRSAAAWPRMPRSRSRGSAGRASFWGRGGDDAAGHEMRDALAREGVDVENFRLFAGGRSSVSGVIVDASGERQIVNFRGSFPTEADWLPLGRGRRRVRGVGRSALAGRRGRAVRRSARARHTDRSGRRYGRCRRVRAPAAAHRPCGVLRAGARGLHRLGERRMRWSKITAIIAAASRR